jgi:hypothetical protein
VYAKEGVVFFFPSAPSEQATSSREYNDNNEQATSSRDERTTSKRRSPAPNLLRASERFPAIFKMSSMQAQSEIDTAVWPLIDDLARTFETHYTTIGVPNHPGQTVDVVDLSVVRKRYDQWRQQYEKLLGLHDDLCFERDQLQIQLTAAIGGQTASDREAALEAEIVSLKADLAAKLAMPPDADAAKWQKESEKQRDLALKWRKRYDTVNELARKIPNQRTFTDPPPPQQIIIQAPPRRSKDHLVDHKPTIFTGAKDFETVATFLGQVEHFVEQGGGAFPEQLMDANGQSYELSLDDKLIDTLWRYVNKEVLDWFKRVTNIARLPPPNQAYTYKMSWDQMCGLFRNYYVPKIAKSVVRTQWRELKFTRNDMTGFNKRAYELIKLLGGNLEIDRESDSGLFEDYWLKLPDVAKNEIAQLERMWGAVNKTVTLGDAMNLTNERYLRMGSSGSTYLSTASAESTSAYAAPQAQAPLAQPVPVTAAQPYYGPEPMDLNAIDGKCFRCGKYGHKASECEVPDFRERSHNWRLSRGGGDTNHRGRGNGARGGYVNTRGGGNRGYTRGGNRGSRSGGNYRVYAIESGEVEDEGEMEWPVEELDEGPGMGLEDLGGGGYAETVASSATATVPQSGNVSQ